MKCTNKRSLALAALSLVLLAASLAAYFLQGREIRFLLSAGLALVWGLVQLYEAFHTKGAAELAAALADERDHYLAAKSSQRGPSHLQLPAACRLLCPALFLWPVEAAGAAGRFGGPVRRGCRSVRAAAVREYLLREAGIVSKTSRNCHS